MSVSHERKFTIGRSRHCDIVLADESVSRVHAELTVLESGQMFLTDCNSRHGTKLLSGEKPHSVRQDFIAPTDVIQFGLVKKTVTELLHVIQQKNPSFDRNTVSAPDPEPVSTTGWGHQARLVRCPHCQAYKKHSESCPQCGR